MDWLRREFLKKALISTGVLAVPPWRRALGRQGKPMMFQPAYLKLDQSGELAKRSEALWKILGECQLCPRGCKVKRLAGEVKICRSDRRLKIASVGPHFGEERPLVGRHGSGTIFFSQCNLRCCFCQNWEIAHRGDGRHLSFGQLADGMLDLQRRGCHNINLVTPTHFVPHIVRALRIAVSKGLRLPLVYNTGGYESLATLKLLDGIVDIYMPDFKFQDGKYSHRFCAEAKDYPQVAATAIAEMHRQVGVLQTDEQGIATRGLIIRHLVMPQNTAGTDRFVRWVAEKLSPKTYVNLMDQYHPAHQAGQHPELARRITAAEWAQVLKWARAVGLENLAS